MAAGLIVAAPVARRDRDEPMTSRMHGSTVMITFLLGAASALAVDPPAPPPLPGRGEAERTSPSVRGFSSGPTANPNALSGPNAPIRIAPGTRVPPERRPDPKTPNRPEKAGPDPLTILRQPQPLVPVDASVEDRNSLDTSLRVMSPESSWPTGFRVPYEHPDDPSYSVRLDGALMLVYQDGLYARRGGRTVAGMPPGAWYVIGRDDLRPRVQSTDPVEPAPGDPALDGEITPEPAGRSARAAGLRLDLRVIPVRPEPAPAAPARTIEAAPGPAATGLRILRDEAYRRRFLRQLVDRCDEADPPVNASPAGS